MMKAVKNFMNKPITWGNYCTYAAIAFVAGTVALAYWFGGFAKGLNYYMDKWYYLKKKAKFEDEI